MDALSEISESKYSNSLIYIVEDNQEMRSMLEKIIGKFYKYESFENGELAKNAISKKWPDLVLSDVMMPVMGGSELCESIKSDIITSHIPVVLLTACNSMDEQIKGLKDGADLYLAKPFYPKYLITCLEMILNSRAKLRDRFKSGIPITISAEGESESDNKFLEKFQLLITSELANEDVDFDAFARELGVNRTHFYQKIRSLTGETPLNLLREQRLVEAAKLLANKDVTIEDVCVRTGFKSRTHFSKLFKTKYGVSPGKYHSSVTN